MTLSIVIPTYNRGKVLIKCLDALFNQIYFPDKYEIIIIDDGSTDNSNHTIKMILPHARDRIKYYEQGHKGPAAARNLAIKNASGKIVLIIGDDIIASPTLLREHMFWHERYPEESVAVLGYVTWSPEVKITPFMNWLENGGPQFGYNAIENDFVDFSHFFTCNVSIKRDFLINNGLFDEDFPYAAYEDIELGYRLQKKGLQIRYNKQAVAYHYHPGIGLQNYKKRMSIVGESEVIFTKKHPELKLKYDLYNRVSRESGPHYLWRFLYEMINCLGVIRFVEGITWRAKQYYLHQLARAFLKGYSNRKKIEPDF
jgi:glycosyltransferase involved in cell wall biosynthesis